MTESTLHPLKQTVLHSTHVALGAKMVDFGGWDMPLSYGSQVQEHNLVRTAAGMFDVSHMLNVDVQGAGATAFFSKLVANNVAKLTSPGRALYTCMLNEHGGVIDDLIIYWRGAHLYRTVVNASTADNDIAHMLKVAKDFDVMITPRRDLAMIAVQGPVARQAVWTAMPGSQTSTQDLIAFSAYFDGDVMIARTGYTGEDGFEIAVPAAQAAALWASLQAAGVAPAGLGARDTLRLEAGMNLYGNDMDEHTSPLEAGLAWTVDMKTERDFIGRAALQTQVRTRTFVGLKLLERGVVRGHMQVHCKIGDTTGLGEITSGTFSPSMNVSIAMARVPMGVQIGDVVQVDVRGKLLNAQVVKMPFVRHGKVLV